MTLVPYDESKVLLRSAAPILQKDTPGFLDVLPAAFRQNNLIYAAGSMLNTPDFARDSQFDTLAAVDASPYRYDYYRRLSQAQSQDEFDYISAKIAQENKDREQMAASGWPGVAAGIVAGISDPTLFVPLVGGAKGVKGVAQAFALAGSVATVQETALYLSQETRTKTEVAIGIGAGTIIGGLLGSAAVYLKAGAEARIKADMVHGQGAETILKTGGDTTQSAVKGIGPSPAYDLSEPIPVYKHGVSTVGDNVVVYDGQGNPVIVQVTRTGGDGVVEVALESDELVTLGVGLTGNNPRAVEYKLQGISPGTSIPRNTAEVRADITKLDKEISALENGTSLKFVKGNPELLAPAVARSRDPKLYAELDGMQARLNFDRQILDDLLKAKNESPNVKGLVKEVSILQKQLAATKPQNKLRLKRLGEQLKKAEAALKLVKGSDTADQRLVRKNLIKHEESLRTLTVATGKKERTVRNLIANGKAKEIAGELSTSLEKLRTRRQVLSTEVLVTQKPQAASRVSELSDAQLASTAAELETQLAKIPVEARSAEITAAQQDYIALVTEARRRLDDASVSGSNPNKLPADNPTKTKIETLAAKGDNLSESYAPTLGDLPAGPRSVGAAVVPKANGFARIFKPGPISGWWLKVNAKLNPNLRVIENVDSSSASRASAQMGDAALAMVGNAQGIPHAPGGTLENRISGHHKILGKFVQSFDNAYANYVHGTNLPIGDAGVVSSQTRSALGKLPGGKLTYQGFGELTYKLLVKGEVTGDTAITSAVNAQRAVYKYFLNESEEAYLERVSIEGHQARRLISSEGKLEPGALEYAHEIYDTNAINRNPTAFMQDVKDVTITNSQASFAKSVTKYAEKEAGEQIKLNLLKMNKVERNALQDTLGKEVADLETTPAMEQYMGTRKRLMDERTAARVAAKEAKQEVDITAMTPAEADAALAKQVEDIGLTTQGLKDAEESVTAFEGLAPKEVLDIQAKLKGLRRQARQLADAPVGTPTKVAAQVRRMEKALDDFDTKWRARGATDIRVADRVANFDEYGNQMATLVHDKITNGGPQISGLDILQGVRGPEIARSLNIPFDKKVRWLITDPEVVVKRYIRQMSADVEIYRAFGSVNATKVFENLDEDINLLRFQADNATHVAKVEGIMRPVAAGTKDAKPITEKVHDAMLERLRKSQKSIKADLHTMIDRLRGLRGRPDDPDGIAFRFGRAALQIGVGRFMGGVVFSSMPDVGMPVIKRGLQKTLRDSWAPMVTDLSRIKLSRARAREQSIGWEVVTQSRTKAVFDLWEEVGGQRTKLEKGIDFLSNQMGRVSLLNRWNSENKLAVAGLGMSDTSRMLRIMNEGGGTAKELQEAVTYLASHGIDENMSKKIWSQFLLKDGSDEVAKGVRLPNTEAWTDHKASTTYRAMIQKITNDTIVTPGLDRPSFTDANMIGRMLAQFQSFTFSSNNRVLSAAIQQQDMAVLSGSIFLLAMGAVSYYLWAVSVGGKVEEEMRKGDLSKWTDEAIARSGLLGVLAIAQRIAAQVPVTAPYTSFSGKATTNRQPRNLMEAALGPTYNLAETVISAGLGLDSPTKRTVHQARLMSFYQNVSYLRRGFDALEATTVDVFNLPERRSNK